MFHKHQTKIKICTYGLDKPHKIYRIRCDWAKDTKFSIEHAWGVLGEGLRYNFQAFFNEYLFRGKHPNDPVKAEEIAFLTYEKANLCRYNHSDPKNCETRNYTNGCGFCIYCGHFVSRVFQYANFCVRCKARCNWTEDINGGYWCKRCSKKMPQELKTRSILMFEKEDQERRKQLND